MKMNKVRDSRTQDSTAGKRIASTKRQLAEQIELLNTWIEILTKYPKDKSVQQVVGNERESQRRKVDEIREALRIYEKN